MCYAGIFDDLVVASEHEVFILWLNSENFYKRMTFVKIENLQIVQNIVVA